MLFNRLLLFVAIACGLSALPTRARVAVGTIAGVVLGVSALHYYVRDWRARRVPRPPVELWVECGERRDLGGLSATCLKEHGHDGTHEGTPEIVW